MCARQHQSQPEKIHWLSGESGEKMRTFITITTLRAVEIVKPIWFGQICHQERRMKQNMVAKPSSIYYVGSKPFVFAWFHC